MSYQIRELSGHIEEHESLKSVLDYIESMKGDFSQLEKISFNGPDGARIRLVFLEDVKAFVFTVWDGNTYRDIME